VPLVHCSLSAFFLSGHHAETRKKEQRVAYKGTIPKGLGFRPLGMVPLYSTLTALFCALYGIISVNGKSSSYRCRNAAVFTSITWFSLILAKASTSLNSRSISSASCFWLMAFLAANSFNRGMKYVTCFLEQICTPRSINWLLCFNLPIV